MWRKGNPLTLLVGMQTSTATMENSVETWEIHGYVTCPGCHNDQYIGIIDGDTDLTREQFNEKFKGRIHGEIPGRFDTDQKLVYVIN